MSTATDVIGPELLDAQPQLYVTDLQAALVFYCDKLGFELVFIHGQPRPFYAQVVRGGARVNLRLAPGPVYAAEFLEREVDPVCATLTADDIGRVHASCRAAGAEVYQELRREPWGARTFIVRDPSGNLVLFSGS